MKDQTFILRRGPRSFTSLVAFLSVLPNDKEQQVTISDVKKERSDLQNNALYGVAYKTLGDFTGYTAPELHDHFLRAYFGEVGHEVMGKTYTRPRRTTTTDENGNRSKLTTLQFCDYYAFIQQKGSEIGCFVPDPDPMWHSRSERAA